MNDSGFFPHRRELPTSGQENRKGCSRSSVLIVSLVCEPVSQPWNGPQAGEQSSPLNFFGDHDSVTGVEAALGPNGVPTCCRTQFSLPHFPQSHSNSLCLVGKL